MWLVIFIGIPVVGAVIGGTSVGAISSFVPSGSQQLVPSDGTSFSRPVTCTTTARSDPKPALASAVRIAYSDDGEIFNVRPGGEVTVRYIYGDPVISPGTPLCLDQAKSTPGLAVFVVGSSGVALCTCHSQTGPRWPSYFPLKNPK